MPDVRHRDGLSFAQVRLLKAMRDYHSRRGYWATVRALQKEMGHNSQSTTYGMIRVLVDKGRVEKLRLTSSTFVYVPVER